MKIQTLLCSALTIIALSSCEQPEPTIYYNTYMTAVQSESGCIFVSDDSLTIVPTNSISNLGSLKTDDRLFATFSVPSGEITDPVMAEFTSLVLLDPLEIIATSSPDTLSIKADDPADLQSVWQSGGVKGASRFLTISYSVKASEFGLPHYTYIVDDLTRTDNPDAEGYYHLRFLHDTNNDPFVIYTSSIATFPLTEKYTGPDIKGIKIDYTPLTAGKDSTLTLTFK